MHELDSIADQYFYYLWEVNDNDTDNTDTDDTEPLWLLWED
jgi:hypothetical protein